MNDERAVEIAETLAGSAGSIDIELNTSHEALHMDDGERRVAAWIIVPEFLADMPPEVEP